MTVSVFVNPKSWGSGAWMFLHCIGETFPESPTLEEQAHYRVFFESLQWVLPCKICRDHFGEWLTMYPLENYLDSRTKIMDWIFLLHNYVNLRLEKPLLLNKEAAQQVMGELCKRQISRCQKLKKL